MSAQLLGWAERQPPSTLSETLPLSRRLVPGHSRLRRQELIQRHVLRLICLGIAILSLAGLLYLTQRSALTTTTYEIQELQLEKQRLQRQRDRLRADIARLTAPERVRARAEALGFEPAQPAEFLAINLPTPPAQPGPPAPVPNSVEGPIPRTADSSGSARTPFTGPGAGLVRQSFTIHNSQFLPALASLSSRAARWMQATLSALAPPRPAEASHDQLRDHGMSDHDF
jgi:cell division protein FtsL